MKPQWSVMESFMQLLTLLKYSDMTVSNYVLEHRRLCQKVEPVHKELHSLMSADEFSMRRFFSGMCHASSISIPYLVFLKAAASVINPRHGD